MDLRCSVISAEDDEPLAATAPTDSRWLFVEQAGDWKPKVELTRDDARVQLIRRPGGGSGRPGPIGTSGRGMQVFWADVATGEVRSGFVDDVARAVDLDPADLTSYDDPLWMVCTHGRRDVCCAERGRPVAAALTDRWPEETWETTHLGGHRFAATLLALPSGIALGRLTPDTVVGACEDLLEGRLPLEVVRGRAGTSAIAQAAEHHVRRRDALVGLGDVRIDRIDGDEVILTTPRGSETLRWQPQHTQRRQSCGGDAVKRSTTYALHEYVPGNRAPFPDELEQVLEID